jgi:Right handed beta helix region
MQMAPADWSRRGPARSVGREKSFGRLAGITLVTCVWWAGAGLSVPLDGQTPSPPANPRFVRDGETVPTPSPAGPKSGITCPAGAINISPGTNIQTVVNARPGGTTFCLKAGIHPIRSSITPKTGNTFVGEYGAILDGTGWTTTDLTQAAFRAQNQDINDVTIRNLVIRRMPQRGIHAYSSGWCDTDRHTCNFSTAGADRWTIEHNEIAENITGVNVPSGAIVRRNYIHHNVGPSSATGAGRGGGYLAYIVRAVLFEENEIAYNGDQQKLSLAPDSIFRNNFVHHNSYTGIWYDGENTGAVIEGNRVEDNTGIGIFYEVNGPGVIRNNAIRRNDNGIFVSVSHGVEIHHNLLEDNWRAIGYFVDCARVGASDGGWIGVKYELRDVSSHDNTIRVGTRPGSFTNSLSDHQCTAAQFAPYLSGLRNLTFTNNTYQVPDVSGSSWLWGGFKTWREWQALGHDPSGTVTLR